MFDPKGILLLYLIAQGLYNLLSADRVTLAAVCDQASRFLPGLSR